MDITQLKKDFLSVNGWKQNRNPSGMQITDMLTSDSGLWFNDIHPMLTYSNIECLIDDDSEYVYPAFDASKLDYAIGNLVSDGGSLFRRIAVSAVSKPTSDTLYWEAYDHATAWLREKTEGAIGDVISDWKTLRATTLGARNLLGNGRLFTNIMIGDPYVLSNKVVGHYFSLPYSSGLKTSINKIATHFTEAQVLTLKLFKFGNLYPIQTISLNYTTPNQEQWHDITLNLESDSKYYLVYDETAISGVPVTSHFGGTWSMGKYVKVTGFKADQGFNETWDTDFNDWTNESNFGLNFDFNVTCDPTDFLIEQKILFADCLYYRMGVNMLKEMAYNAGVKISRHTRNMEWNKNEILFAIEGNPDGHKNGVVYEYNRRLNTLNVDLSGMDRVCQGCVKQKVRNSAIK